MERLKKEINQLLSNESGTWSMVVADLNYHKSLVIDGDRQYNAASIIKLPIMAAAFSQVDKGLLSLDEEVVLNRKDLVGGSGVLQHLSPGLSLTFYDLLTLMIIQSDNTATNMVIDRIGKKPIQSIIQQVGMEHSVFCNRLMIVPADRRSSNLITANDVSLLLKTIAMGDVSSYDACKRMIDIMKCQQIQYLTGHFPDPESNVIGTEPLWSYAGKTGNVTGVYHDTGILYVGDRSCVVTILSEGNEQEQAMGIYKKVGASLYQYMKES